MEVQTGSVLVYCFVLSAELWAEILGEMTVMSSAKPLTVCGTNDQVLIAFASWWIFSVGI